MNDIIATSCHKIDGTCTLSAAVERRNWKLRLQIAFLRVRQFETAEEWHGMVEHRWPWTESLNEWTSMILAMLFVGANNHERVTENCDKHLQAQQISRPIFKPETSKIKASKINT